MSKFVKKANELLSRVQSLIDAFEVNETASMWDDPHKAPAEILNQYPDLLADVQLLLFCDSPEHPLYLRALRLNDRIDDVLGRKDARFIYSDFVTVRNILSKYVEYRRFAEEES